MSMQTDVKAISLAASGAATDSRARVRGLVVEPSSTSDGSVVVKNGGASGTTLFTINTLSALPPTCVVIPAEGVLCSISIYVVLTNAKVTVFYA